MLFGVQNGVVDVERATVRPGCKHDRITKVAAVTCDPQGQAPRWERFLEEVFADVLDVVPYLQRVFGFALTEDFIKSLTGDDMLNARHPYVRNQNPSGGS